MHLWQTYKRNEGLIDFALQRIYSRYDLIRVADVAEELGISRRHFQKMFNRSAGTSPKSFHRNARFQHTIKQLILDRQSDYLPYALSSGYYDQSHFIKDFQFFTGTTPTSFLQEDNFRSHFYNTPA